MATIEAELIHIPQAAALPKYRGFITRHPAPMNIAISPAPYKYNELRYRAASTYETSEARKRRENPDA